MEDVERAKLQIIHVEEIVEGISSWRIALSELLVFANMTNAIVVEPCIISGRLYGGNRCLENKAVPLRQVFNISHIMDIAPIMSQSEYQGINELSQYRVCIHARNPPDKCGDLKPIYASNDTCPFFLANHAKVLIFQSYRRNGIIGLNANYVDFVLHHIDFIDQHYHQARSIVARLGFNLYNYVVFQWRSELKATTSTKLRECAHALIKSKQNLQLQTERVILVTDLITNKNHAWSLMRLTNQIAIKDTLQLLHQHKFIQTRIAFKNDYASFKQIDLIFISIWEALIAASAKIIVTCSDCKSNTCDNCMWQGNFARMILDLRYSNMQLAANVSSTKTYTCWPS